MTKLEKAVAISVKYHKGQKDKAGNPYILHPLRVMMNFSNEEEMITAVLHDVVEDSVYTPDRLKKDGFSNKIVKAVGLLTKDDGPDFNEDEYYRKIAKNALARKVKMADLKDNMNLMRIKKPGKKDFERIKKYEKHYGYLQKYS
ncbi:MAG: GTP pyrophosphokinase [Ignavibacteria bacterium]|jgi:(p)ppGpp synthase/HD superfamily hydrolase|nr:GTP pyrophosphokinase [Ignavibacteria bacterium]